MNLVANAAEAMPDGGEMTIELANRYIDRPLPGYDTIQEGEYLLLTVSDSGVGIPCSETQRIFEPFYTKKKMGRSGTGLGMTVVYGTVKDHDGYIDVESEEGRGTTFRLYFPVFRGSLAEVKAPPEQDLHGNGETVLVVDDVAEQREIASQLLDVLGYSVEAAENGEAALSYLKRHRVDLVLLDMIMDPGIDGLETYRRILDLHPGQRAVIASGFSDEQRVNAAREMGIAAYLRKPYTLDKMAGAIKEALAGS
jgi:CheY-like chemotaxis protein